MPRPRRSGASARSATVGSAASSRRRGGPGATSRSARPQAHRAARSNRTTTESISRSATANCPRRSSRRSASADPTSIPASSSPTDWSTLHRRLDDYIAAGLTKFVIRPCRRMSTADFLEAFVAELLPTAELGGRFPPVRSRCLHAGPAAGPTLPSSSSSWVRRMRRFRVASCLASSTQQMNSLRAKGVMSFQAASAVRWRSTPFADRRATCARRRRELGHCSWRQGSQCLWDIGIGIPGHPRRRKR